MKNLAYIVPIKDIKRSSIGVLKKIQIQKEVFKKYNINVNYLDISSNKNKFMQKIYIRLPFVGVPNSWKKIMKVKNVDVIYIRYSISHYQMIRALKKIKKNNPSVKILVEIPTYPYENETLLKLESKPLLWKDKYNRKKLNKYVDRIVTYSNDKVIFGIPTINISNGINLNKVKKKENIENSTEINMIAVALFNYWHGYDRVIEGLKNYYRKKGSLDKIIRLHLVGEGAILEEYKRMVNKYNLNEYIKFYGKLEGRSLDQVYNKCDIGLDAMGRHRSNVYYNSSLKGKEYAGKGLPIISGVTTELDFDSKFEYYLRIPADETPLNIEEVIKFYEIIYKEKTKEEVSNNIRKYAEENYNIDKCLEPIIKYIKDE